MNYNLITMNVYVKYVEKEAIKEVARNLDTIGIAGVYLSIGEGDSHRPTLFLLRDDIKGNLYDTIRDCNTYQYGYRFWQGKKVGGRRVPTDTVMAHITIVDGDFTSITYNKTITFKN